MHTIIRQALLLVMLSFSAWALGAQQPMDEKQFVGDIVDDLETNLRSALHKGQLKNKDFVDNLLKNQLLSHFDMPMLCKKVFAQDWEHVVAEGREQDAVAAVEASILRTYHFAFSTYGGQDIEVVGAKSGKKYSVVRIKVEDSKGRPHSLDFAIYPKNGGWHVFDMNIDGIVMSKTLGNAIRKPMEENGVVAAIAAINPSR